MKEKIDDVGGSLKNPMVQKINRKTREEFLSKSEETTIGFFM